MKNSKIHFKCPYQEFSCPFVDTMTATLDKQCSECEHYDNGVKPTGGIYIPEFIKKLFKLK